MSASAILKQPPETVARILTAARAAKEAREPDSIEDRLQLLYNNEQIEFSTGKTSTSCQFNVDFQHGDPQTLSELGKLLTAKYTGLLKIERSDNHQLIVEATGERAKETYQQLVSGHEAFQKNANERLLVNYQTVAAALRNEDPESKVAAFIEARLQDKAVHDGLIKIAKQHAKKLSIADDIKAQRAMKFSTEDAGDVLHVHVMIDGSVPAYNVKAMFDVTPKIYNVLFGDQMHNIESDTRSAPRTMDFDCTGEMRQFFEGWKLNKVAAGVGK